MDRILCLLIYVLASLAQLGHFSNDYEEWREGKKIKILLAGYNGARNTGSDVRVVAIVEQLKSLFKEQAEITVMTMDEESLAGYFGDDVKLLRFSSLFPFDLFKACSSHHVTILVEGSTLKSTFANALTLFLCEAAGVTTHQGKPCIAYGSEVGKMEMFLSQAAKRLCRKTYFVTRTKNSLDQLRKLGLQGHNGTDTAWIYDKAISSEEAECLLKKQGWDGKMPLLGIAVINPFCWPVRASLWKWIKGHFQDDLPGQYDKWYFFSDSPERRKAYHCYIDEIAKGVNAFLVENEFFPVVVGMERLDEKACKEVRQKLNAGSAIFLSRDTSGNIMTGILRKLSLLVTSRYHASVLSMESGCPIVAVSMDERLDGIMQETNLEDYLLKVSDHELGRKIQETLSRCWKEKESIHELIQQRLPQYKKTLDEMGMFLKRYIQESLGKA